MWVAAVRNFFACCKDCPDRYPACSGSCDRYAAGKCRAAEKIYDAAIALIDKTMDGIQAIEPEQAKALKYYSGVLRDLQDVLDLRPELDIREQDAPSNPNAENGGTKWENIMSDLTFLA